MYYNYYSVIVFVVIILKGLLIFISEIIIVVFLLSGILSGISYNYGYNYGYQQGEKESNPKCFSEKMEAERDTAICHNENKHLVKESRECEAKLTECLNDYKVLKEEKHSAIVKLTECETARKAEKGAKSKDSDNQYSKKMLLLEKANVTCHSDYRNLNTITAKCEKDLIQCKSDRDMLRESFTALKGDYVECLTTSKLSLEFEDEKNKNRKQYFEDVAKLEISVELEKCETNRKKCVSLYGKCKKDLEEGKKGWM